MGPNGHLVPAQSMPVDRPAAPGSYPSLRPNPAAWSVLGRDEGQETKYPASASEPNATNRLRFSARPSFSSPTPSHNLHLFHDRHTLLNAAAENNANSRNLAGDSDFVEDSPVETVRVLHLVNGEHYAGAERVQDLLALRLPEFGVEPALGCLKPGRFPILRRSQATPLHELPMRGRWDLRPASKLARLLRREGFDLLHTHTPRAALIGQLAAQLAGVPMIHHVHGQTATEVRRRWWSGLMARVERFSVTRAAAVVAVSPTAARYMAANGVAESRIRVVPNGVPAHDTLPTRTLPTGEWTLGTIALFRPRKGLETVLSALSLLRRQGFAARLRAVGSFETADYQREVLQYAADLKIEAHVDWLGFQSDIDRQLAKMDLLVFPSLLAEGLPMVPLEAMAAGVPIVASRVDVVTDLVRDGIEGLLCRPGDADELAAAVGRIIRGESDWQTLRRRAHRRQARSNFSDREMADAIAKLYREVLKR